MLPGFRFLFAAIALTMSILIFGLGAAALLRAAHEEFASVPSWRTAPETMFAQPSEASPPVLAMLRVEPRVDEQKASDNIPDAEVFPAEPAAEKLSSSEPDEPEVLTAESSGQDKATPAQADASTGTDTAETKVAANEAILMPLDEPVALTKIATLNNPAVLLDAPKPAKASAAKADNKAKPDQTAIKKRLQARQAAQRRRLALRARLAQQQQLQQADPFTQPAIQPTVQPVRKR
jgi:hypothetical protein